MTKALAKRSGKAEAPATGEDEVTALKAELVDGVLTISGGKAEQRELMTGLASECRHYSAMMIGQMLDVITTDRSPENITHGIRCATELLKGFAPQNQLEAMLAVQGVCAHMAGTCLTRRAMKATQIPQMEANGNLANKFMRTFVAQVEGLAKLRRNGEQVVKHLYVGEGGRAVIAGTVHSGGAAR